MPEIQQNGLNANLISMQNYLKNSTNVGLSDSEASMLDSIFSQCDTKNTQGLNGADGILSGDEIELFQNKVETTLKRASGAISKFFEGLNSNRIERNNPPQQMTQGNEIQIAKTNPFINNSTQVNNQNQNIYIRNQEERTQYINTLNQAKDMLLKNAEALGISPEEIEYIKSADIEEYSMGSARHDSSKDKVVFNINDANEPNIGNFIKVLIHEANHGITKKNTTEDRGNSQKQERECETRALEVSLKMYNSLPENERKNFDFRVFKETFLSDLNNKDDINKFVDDWIAECYSKIPKE